MEPLPIPGPTVTHPETAWLIDLVPVAATVGLIFLCTLLLGGRLRAALDVYLLRRFGGASSATIESALLYRPPIITAGQLLAICLGVMVAVVLALSHLTPLFAATVLSGPLTALLIWGLLSLKEQAYISALDGALPAAVGRLEAQLRAGSGIQAAIEKVIADLAPSPLKAEWQWLVERMGVPLESRTLATPVAVCAALLAQTPSRRHATFLAHLEIALEQPHSALAQRMAAAHEALQAAQRRRSTAITALSQMRNTGMVMFLVALTTSAYLVAVQRERVARAFADDVGVVVGLVFVTAILAPLIGGQFLARVDDLDY
jgi:hypothetical protein